jgi:tRNA 2-selenouridine synthase
VELMINAFDTVSDTGRDLHRRWIELLLTRYYDPMYEYQINRREGEVLARGNRDEIIEMANRIGASNKRTPTGEHGQVSTHR